MLTLEGGGQQGGGGGGGGVGETEKILTLDEWRQHPLNPLNPDTVRIAKLPSKSRIVREKEAVESLSKVELARRSYLTQRRYRQYACILSGVGGRSRQLQYLHGGLLFSRSSPQK